MTENIPAPQRRRPWPWWMLGIGVALLLLYWGYCWGWWFRDNLLVQAIFQCNCPTVSEAARYASFRVVVSGCRDPQVRLSPTGQRVVIVEKAGTPQAFVLTHALQSTQQLPLPGGSIGLIGFLRDDLLYVEQDKYFFLVFTDGPPAQIFTITQSDWDSFRANAHDPGTFYYISANQTSVFIPEQHPEQAVFIAANVAYERLAGWAMQHGSQIVTVLDRERYRPLPGVWRASFKGIIDTRTGAVVVRTPYTDQPASQPMLFEPVGWLVDERTLLFRYYANPHIIGGGQGTLSLPPMNFFRVPQPILALDVPEELLSATPTATP